MLCNVSRSLVLIDCRSDSIMVDSAITEAAFAAAHTGDGEKVYLVRSGRLEIRSSTSLDLLAAIDWPYCNPIYRATTLAYSDTTRKLYWFVGDSVLAIDATRDSVTARMTTSVSYKSVCLDHTGRYLFCASHLDSTLRVYDTELDSLVAAYPFLPPPSTNPAVTASSEQHRIYLGCIDVILVYPDAPPGVEEATNDGRGMMNRGASVVGDILFLPGATSRKSQAASLMDASGRKVMDLEPGANDVRALAPGVYFIRGPKTEDGRADATVRKIVITR
jgi:hypothetical protein